MPKHDLVSKQPTKQIELTLNDMLFGHIAENIKDKTIQKINPMIMRTKMAISKFKYGNKIDI